MENMQYIIQEELSKINYKIDAHIDNIYKLICVVGIIIGVSFLGLLFLI